MKNIALIMAGLALAGMVSAQDIQKTAKAKSDVLAGAPADTAKKHWKVSGTGSLQFTQASFTNWAAGGENSIGVDGWINLKVNYSNGRHVWGNNLDLGYGFNYLGKGGDARFTKTNDKIEFTTAYGYDISKDKKWFVTALANFRTQFSNGYNYPNDSTVISTFMAPGYLVVGAGITYAPANWFMVYLSPASGRFTFVNDQKLADAGSFGVEAGYWEINGTDTVAYVHGKTFRGEVGPYLRANLNKDLAKNINLNTTLELFTDYLHNFGDIDVNWSLLLSLKVNKWLAASVQTQLIYDDDVKIKYDPNKPAAPRTQFKEMIGVGLTYKFN